MGAGVKLEADLLPHLRGLSAGLFAEPARPGRLTGALVVLHLDEPDAARRLVEQAGPRLGNLTRRQPESPTVVLRARGRDVRIAWGDGVRWASGDARPEPVHSLSAFCGELADKGGRPPSRVAALWPAKLWRPSGMSNAPALALADDPPVILRGWSEADRERDLVEWNGMAERVRRVLAAVPAAKFPESGGPPGIRD